MLHVLLLWHLLCCCVVTKSSWTHTSTNHGFSHQRVTWYIRPSAWKSTPFQMTEQNWEEIQTLKQAQCRHEQINFRKYHSRSDSLKDTQTVQYVSVQNISLGANNKPPMLGIKSYSCCFRTKIEPVK